MGATKFTTDGVAYTKLPSAARGEAGPMGPMTTGRNRLLNGALQVNQRNATSVVNPGGVSIFDLWRGYLSGGSLTYSAVDAALGELPESAPKFARLAISGQSGTSQYSMFYQPIESVRTLSGKTVTLSFWAKANSASLSVAGEFHQSFGSGGSAAVLTAFGKVQLSTTWQRYSLTTNVPSLSGMTIGTANDYARINIWISAGSSFNSRTDSLGIQAGTFDFWGLQLEEGPVATDFARRTYVDELWFCQRYFQRWTQPPLRGAMADPSFVSRLGMVLPVPMRITPTLVLTGTPSLFDGVAAANLTVIHTNLSNRFVVEFNGTASTTYSTYYRPVMLYQQGAHYIDFVAEY